MGNNVPLSLVKYATASTGIKILFNKKLRWSAPHVFSDPFENSSRTPLGFDQFDLTKTAVKAIASMIFARDDPRGEVNSIKKAVRRWRAEDRFHNEEEAQEALSELLPTMISQRYAEVEEFMRAWKLYAFNARILCLSDSFEDMTCWELFANQHQGIAIRFKVGEGHTVEDPKRLAYRSQRNVVTTLKEQVSIFVGEENTNDPTKLEENLLVKPKMLTAQREWRSIWLPDEYADPDGEDLVVAYDDRPFSVGDVSAVYLGACISDANREKVLSILTKFYPKAKVYEAEANEAEYKLDFIKTSGAVAKDLSL